MTFTLRNERTLNVLLWSAAGTVPGDRLLPGEETVAGAAKGGEWLSRLLGQEPRTGADGLSPRDRQSAWNQWGGQFAPLLWPNREVILRVRVDGPEGQGTTRLTENLGEMDGAATQFRLSRRPVVEESETVRLWTPYRWTDYASTTWAELAGRTWRSAKEERILERGVDYTIDYETGEIELLAPPDAGAYLEVVYAYWEPRFHGLLG